MTDPALIRVWPRKWLEDRDIAPTIRYLDRYLHDFKSTTETTISTTINRDAYDSTIGMVFGKPGLEKECPSPYDGSLTAPFDNEQPLEYNEATAAHVALLCKTISAETYVAVDNMFINATNAPTLVLPENPCENCIVNFTKDATKLILKGNGRKVNGTLSDIVFRQNRLARQIHYFIDVDEWFFV